MRNIGRVGGSIESIETRGLLLLRHVNAGNIGIWWSIDIWHIGTITATRYLGLLIGGTPRVVIHLLQSILLFLFAFENGFEILPTGIVLLIATNFAIRRDPSLRIFQFRQCLVNISAKLFLVVIDFDLQKMSLASLVAMAVDLALLTIISCQVFSVSPLFLSGKAAARASAACCCS